MPKKLNRNGRKKAYKYASKDKTKSRNRLLHFMRRFQERHGYVLSLADVDNILEQIALNTAELISRNRKGYLYKVNCRNKKIAVAVAACKKELITTYKLEEKHYKMINEQKEIAERKKKSELAVKRKSQTVSQEKLRESKSWICKIKNYFQLYFICKFKTFFNFEKSEIAKEKT